MLRTDLKREGRRVRRLTVSPPHRKPVLRLPASGLRHLASGVRPSSSAFSARSALKHFPGSGLLYISSAPLRLERSGRATLRLDLRCRFEKAKAGTRAEAQRRRGKPLSAQGVKPLSHWTPKAPIGATQRHASPYRPLAPFCGQLFGGLAQSPTKAI